VELPLESLVRVKGLPQDGAVEAVEYTVISTPILEREVDYLSADSWSPVVFAKHAVWGFRNPRFAKTILLQHHIMRLTRSFLYEKGFIELLPPVISPSSDPGLRGAKKLTTLYYGSTYELSSSLIMYKQLSVGIFEKVFFTARNVREEPTDHALTGRHLSEFTQVDIEWGLATVDDVMKLAEELLREVSKTLADSYGELIESIGLRKEPVVFEPPFPRLTYDEALEILKRMGFEVEWGRELPFEAEAALASYYGTPVWVTNYPSISRGFYYLTRDDDPRYNVDFNLLLPEGYGEVIDGGSREYRYHKLVERIKASGEPLEKYTWFLELVKQGAVPPSSGWGLGVERLTAYIAGHKHVVYASLYPKLPGVTGTP